MKRLLVLLPVALLAVAACGGGDDTATASGQVSDAVVEGVRAELPRTQIADIAAIYSNIQVDVPNVTDDQAIQWILEADEWNTAVEAWNTCLEEVDETGGRCDEPADSIFSADNPLNW